MNSPLLLLALLTPAPDPAQKVLSAQDAARLEYRVRAFLDAVAPFLDRAGPLRDDTTAEDQRVYPGSRLYRFSNSGCLQIQAATGRVLTYVSGQYDGARAEDADGNVVPRGVDDAEAAALARRFFAAAGWTGSVRIIEIADLQGNNETGIDVFFSRLHGSVPEIGGSSVEVDRQTGRLDKMYISPPFSSPPSLTPLGTPDEARLVALQAAQGWLGGRVFAEPQEPFGIFVSPSTPLSLEWETGEGAPRSGTFANATKYQSLTPAEAARSAAGESVLIYAGTIRAGQGEPVYIRLDARTGHVLTMERTNFGMGGGGSPSASRPVLVPTASRPWRVGTGGGGWKAWTAPATAALVPAPKPPAKGAKVLLTDGRAAFPATYDPKANLLGVSGRGYRPGPALAALLRKRAKV